MMNEYIFNKIDCDNDKYWVIKSFLTHLISLKNYLMV